MLTIDILFIVLTSITRTEKVMSKIHRFRKYRYNLEILASRLPLIEAQLDKVYAQFLEYWSKSSHNFVADPTYEALLLAVQNLGFGWTRDPLGKHKVFIPKYQI